jgi:hypothetical protein
MTLPKPFKDTVPKINQAIKIPIKRIIQQDGWSQQINGYNLELDVEHRRGRPMLILTVNGDEKVWWPVQEQPIKCHELKNGGGAPWDKCWNWYVVGRDGKRCRALYLWGGAHIGTRTDLHLRYPSHCMSRKQRAIYSQQFERRKARKRRRLERRIARYRARLGIVAAS